MNHITLQGRLTKDVELTYGQSGSAIAKFSLAVNRKRTETNGERKADFFNCTAFGKRAETLANYVQKGHKLLLSGSIEMNNYQNKTYYNVMVNDFDLIESNNNNNNNNNQSQNNQQNFNNGNQQNKQNNQQNKQNNNYLSQQQNNNGQGQKNKQGDYFGGGFSQIDISDDDLPF